MKISQEKFKISLFVEMGLKLFLCGLLFFALNKFEVFLNFSMFQKVLISLIPIWVDLIMVFLLFICLAVLTIMYLPELYVAKKISTESVNVEKDTTNSSEE